MPRRRRAAGPADAGVPPDLPALAERFAPVVAAVPEVIVTLPALETYDALYAA
jgi:hypothetical protein